ncbi:MAG: hypothetical protein K9J06_05150 [Flavobacteriales bacterium]|nr:hypothetical protein [Flavobacteriales bacterium]
MSRPKEFKIRFNTMHHESSGVYWRAIIDGEEFLVSDVEMNVYTASHVLPAGEQKWSITCVASNYWIDEHGELFIYNH